MENTAERLIGTALSDYLYQLYGLSIYLLLSSLLITLSAFLTLLTEQQHDQH
jgi:hypothetical protein